MNKGAGVNQDFQKAAELFLKSAKMGIVPAQYMTGRLYYDGKGFEQNREEAEIWIGRAAANGYIEAIKWCKNQAGRTSEYLRLLLWNMYAHGRGVSKNKAEAAKWFATLAGRIHPMAKAELYLVKIRN